MRQLLCPGRGGTPRSHSCASIAVAPAAQLGLQQPDLVAFSSFWQPFQKLSDYIKESWQRYNAVPSPTFHEDGKLIGVLSVIGHAVQEIGRSSFLSRVVVRTMERPNKHGFFP